MATKPLTIAMTCCAGVIALAIGWIAGDDLFFRAGSSDAEETAQGLSVLIKTLPSPNRDMKQDKTAPQEKIDAGLRGALAYADNPPKDFSDTQTAPAPMPPPMRPNEFLKNSKPSRAYLNDAQIAGIKKRLKLSKAQEKFWLPVEASLRGVVNQITDYQARLKISRAVSFDIDSPDIRQLKVSAKALYAQLRADQKNEVMMLARMAGLGPAVMAFVAEPEVAKDTEKDSASETAKNED